MDLDRSSSARIRSSLTTLGVGGRYWLFIDQLLSSLTNLLPVAASILVSADKTVADIGVAAGAAAVAVSVARNAVVVPFQLWGPKSWNVSAQRAVMSGLSLGVLLIPMLVLTRMPVWAVLLCAFGCFLVVTLETARGIELAVNGGKQIAVVDLLWLLCTTIAISVGLATDSISLGILLAAYFLPITVLTPFVWLRIRKSVRWANSDIQAPVWPIQDVLRLVVNGLLGQSVGFMAIGLSALLGPQPAATWQAARVAFRPIGIFANLLPVVIPGRLVRARSNEFVRTLGQLSRRVTGIVTVAAVLLMTPGIFIVLNRGASFAAAFTWTILVAVEFIVVIRFTIDQIALFAIDRGNCAVRLRVVVLIAQGLGLLLASASNSGLTAETLYVAGVIAALALARLTLRRSEVPTSSAR